MIGLLIGALLVTQPPPPAVDSSARRHPAHRSVRPDFVLPRNLQAFRPKMVIVYDLAGGHVGWQLPRANAATVAEVRAYLKSVSDSVAKGNYTTHFGPDSPNAAGAKVMIEKRALIRVRYRDLPWGGELYMLSPDDEVARAITTFLRAVNRRFPG